MHKCYRVQLSLADITEFYREDEKCCVCAVQISWRNQFEPLPLGNNRALPLWTPPDYSVNLREPQRLGPGFSLGGFLSRHRWDQESTTLQDNTTHKTTTTTTTTTPSTSLTTSTTPTTERIIESATSSYKSLVGRSIVLTRLSPTFGTTNTQPIHQFPNGRY